MPSTYTVNLGIEKPATGEQSGTWGDTTNINFDILDQAINGCLSLTLASAGTSGSPNTLAISDGATSDGRNKWVEFVDGGDLGATAYVQLTPNDAEKIVFIRNSLSGSRSVILFQGTYDAGRDLEVPAGVDMVVKFSGGGATATTTDLFTKLRATEITTPTLTTDDLTAGTADINDGTVEAVIGGTTPKAGTFTTLTANTNLTINATTTVDGVIDDDTMATASATKLATSESIKAYVDSSVGAQDTLSEILANGNTSGANNLIIDSGQALTANTINETTAGSGVTIDSVLLKDDGVNATQIEVTNIKANDGTAAGSIANSTGAFTINSLVSNSVDIGGGNIDDTTIGGTTAAGGNFTTLSATGALTGTTATFVGANTLTLRNDTATDANEPKITFDNDTFAGANYAKIQTQNGGLILNIESPSTSTFQNRHKITLNAGGSDDITFYSSTDNGSTYVNYFSIDGGNAIFNETGADKDFRVESDSSTHMLFVDASANKIGINESTPDALLHLRGTENVDDTKIYMKENDTFGAYIKYDGFENVGVIGGLSPSENEVMGWSRAGSYVVFNEQSNDMDFRVESDSNTHALFVNAGSSTVSINKSTAAADLDVGGSIIVDNTQNISVDTTLAAGQMSMGQNSDSGGWGLVGLGWSGGAAGQTASFGYAAQTFYFGLGDGSSSGSLQSMLQMSRSNEAVFNNNSNNIDFRVESDSNTHALFVDASANIVNIGDSASNWTAPSLVVSAPMLDLSSSTARTTNAGIVLRPSSSIDSNGWYGMLFSNSTVDGYGYTLGGRRTQTSGDLPGFDIRYHSNNTTGVSRMYFASNQISVNEESGDFDFRVESDSNAYALYVDAGSDYVSVGQNAVTNPGNGNNNTGWSATTAGRMWASTGADHGFNRTSDGVVLSLRSEGQEEGSISISGTTCSYNGGHLSRWSQPTDNARISGLLKGTVMTNLDQMAYWPGKPNEQLNCMAVSSIEGDANVAGVFVNWDDREGHIADMNIAMTGDMIIRIAQGVTVQRGDLLMSAGDGTAKPQGDDFVRSKTIAKVTSNHVTCTYDDGSYCVPCVLMAC